MPRVVNGSYSTEAKEFGNTIDIPVPTAVSTIDVTPSNTPPASSGSTPGLVQLQLNKWKQNDPIHLTDNELTQIDKNKHFLPMQMSEALKSLANDVNVDIHNNYRNLSNGVFGATGTAGTTPFATTVAAATQGRKLLSQQLAPKTDRRGILDFDAEANALELSPFADAEKTMSSMVKIEGEIGRKYGIDWMSDDAVLTHTAGTLDNGTIAAANVNNGAGYAIGASSVNIDETSLTGTIVLGDVISFAGHSQTYCVIENTSSAEYSGAGDVTTGVYTAASNAITGLSFYPALVAAVADNEVMTLTATHVVNMVMHRDAMAYATRPLAVASTDLELGSKIQSMQDPVTGLILRLEVSRQHKQVVWEFDILWGSKLVRPELAARVLG